MKANIREFEGSDYPSIALVHDSNFPGLPFFRKRVEYEDSCYGRTRYRMKRLVAESGSGEVVGFGEYKHLFFSYHPRKFAIDIEVRPEWQKRRVGGMLYHQIMQELSRMEAETASPLVLSTSISAVEFLLKRGFVQKRVGIESRLDLEDFDPHRFSASVDSLRGIGMTITSFSDEMTNNQSAGKKFKDLEDSGAADVPGALSDLPMNFHDYEIIILNNPLMIWEGSFVAKLGGVYAGSSSIFESGQSGMVDQGFTVVNPAYRGRGVARALKAQVATCAKSKGYRYIRTYNDSENAPMLAVNRKIGFAKQAEWLFFEKLL